MPKSMIINLAVGFINQPYPLLNSYDWVNPLLTKSLSIFLGVVDWSVLDSMEISIMETV